MRIEGVAPRTWVLATIAGWALLLWTVALLGMGEHVQRLPADPTMLQRLPQLAPAPPEQLGPLTRYSEISSRPLFSEDRRPQPFSLTPEGDANAPPAFNFVLTSVLLTPQLKMAIVQPADGGDSIRIKLGEAAEQQPAWRLTTLNPRSATFEGPEGEKNLDLRVYNGTGGDPPTVLRGADAASAPGSAAGRGAGLVQPAAKPDVPPAPPPVDASPATDADAPADASPTQATQDAQIDSIRKRIEERRAQLRQGAQTPPASPPKNP